MTKVFHHFHSFAADEPVLKQNLDILFFFRIRDIFKKQIAE